MIKDRYLIAKEFSFLSTEDIIINKFTKPPNNSMSYETTRHAFIIHISGESEIYFGDQKFIATPGKIIHGCPNKKVLFKVLGNDPFNHINIYYSKPFKNVLYNNSTFEFTVDNFEKLSNLLNEFYIICSTSNIKTQLKKDLLFQSLISIMFSVPNSIDIQKDLIKNSVKYIKENYYNTITLQDLADKYDKSPQQFSYLFYKYMGIRPIDYIIQYRLKKSFEMLNDGYKVREVALSVGYDDPYYFSRLFKKHFNFSPSEVNKDTKLLLKKDI